MSASAGKRPVRRVCCQSGVSPTPGSSNGSSALSSRVTATAPAARSLSSRAAAAAGAVSSRSCSQLTALPSPLVILELAFEVVDAHAAGLEGRVAHQVPVQGRVGAYAL